ncbi:WD and tetratricopeptide repeat-containing protein [Massariosphaeria phaeospora]|uniref:WD and tetratricopeptide repeat-containing protein n=1 Tax=Massariosphaeria phaeospora TaxID=100035 RepID=A0A7C8I128_9PLEO|nr:WD and tetratricopeptide repeat-containing protein [Massariosphaeria phaeospora]
MQYTVYDRLLQRELGQDRKRYSSIRGIYGDRKWVGDLDIVNELAGHNGCVNALSWSRSGRLLASGSDDHRINIHSYNPESSTSPFSLTTSILTGHRSNIFSVKFMPYSNDRTIVSATDDVRIFDIEHSGHSAFGSAPSNNYSQSGRRRAGIHGAPEGLTLTEGDTNAKAFRCHTDTVKRIVTEDNPFYFLTCSEDGDVRQWDIRQPSRIYPPAREGMRPTWADANAADNVPPPLISYSRYHLDLNTISCSPSQPHYIALGGHHLHCFLHDRRMLGRDQYRERGAKLSSPSNWTGHEDGQLGKATQCVKKFAPNGQRRMRRSDNGHITACKISDANPNELVVSWSADWIYSFDMMRSPDATEDFFTSKVSVGSTKRRAKDKSQKRKRPQSNVMPLEAAERGGSRQRTESSQASESAPQEGLALRVNYGNGQSEEIRIGEPETPLSHCQAPKAVETGNYRIGTTAVRILYQLSNLSHSSSVADDPVEYTTTFDSVLWHATSSLPIIDEVARTWRYPVEPNAVEVAVQNQLRDARASTRRCVQAAGTLARVLGGHLRTRDDADAMISRYYTVIQPAPSERPLSRREQFGYDFLKAILLWLDSGPGSLVEGFSSPSSNPRLPINPDASIDDIDTILIPYLLRLAGETPVVDVDVSRFERDETRILFPSEKASVIAFARAVKIPFADLTGVIVPAAGSSLINCDVQDRKDAVKRWAFKIARSVLLTTAKHIRFSFVNRAFGGLGNPDARTIAEEEALRVQQEDIDPLEEEEEAELISRGWVQESTDRSREDQAAVPSASQPRDINDSTAVSAGNTTGGSVVEEEVEDVEEEEDEDEELDDDVDDEEEDYNMGYGDMDDDDEDDEDGLSRIQGGRVLWRSDTARSHLRESVESDVPCPPHTRKYTGHCNVRTVKDVNFFGLQDEYVVSGSDSGHVFIWDRKTSQLLNILEGDGEVVNVVQAHPYEPTIAVSGIDHTIKIFSPDAQAQRNARRGIGINPADPSLPSLNFGRRRRPVNTSRTVVPPDPSLSEDEEDQVVAGGLSSRKRMHDQYAITSRNDMDRRGGGDDAFISRGLLAQIARRLRDGDLGGAPDPDDSDVDADDDGPVVVDNDEGCTVM